jgi:hypothetical protein
MQMRRETAETIAVPSIAYEAGRDVRRAIGRIGRTEDIAFSPAGDRIAIAGFWKNRILLLDVDADWSGPHPRVALTGCLELECDTFRLPHGVAWADDSTLFVASRDRHVAILPLPAEQGGARRIAVTASRLIGADGRDLVATPSSLHVAPAGAGLVELLVCNDFVHHVSRHLIDRRIGEAVLASELLLVDAVEEPHGIVQSPSGRWIAVANYLRHHVLLLRNDDGLDRASEPDGILTGVIHPHGVRFGADERSLLVSESGGPFVHLFRSEDGDWSGTRASVGRIQAISDAAFRRGNRSPQDGGPKGIALSPDNRLLAASGETQPLAMFDMAGVLAPATAPSAEADDDGAERARATMVRYLRRARAAAHHESEAIRMANRYEREELIRRQELMERLTTSRSWRLTHPLRWLNTRAKRIRSAMMRTGR